MTINNSEQWKLKGQCSICRRKTYCKKQCKANKETFTDVLKTEITKKVFGRFGKEQRND